MAFQICTYARAASSTCGLKILCSAGHFWRETAGLSKKWMHFWTQRSGNKISCSRFQNWQMWLSLHIKLQSVAIQPNFPREKTTCEARLAPETQGRTARPLIKYCTTPPWPPNWAPYRLGGCCGYWSNAAAGGRSDKFCAYLSCR